MPGKAKQQKHTTKEIERKHHLTKMKKGGTGGGEDGVVNRKAPKGGKTDPHLKCEKCLTLVPGLKSMKIHYEGKHPKEDWEKAILLYQPSEPSVEKKEEIINNKWQDNVDYDNYEDNDIDEECKEEECKEEEEQD